MPLRTPEKKSPLSGEGRLLSSSVAESDGVENFDSRLAVDRRVSLSAIMPHARGCLRGVYGSDSKPSPAATLHTRRRLAVEGREERGERGTEKESLPRRVPAQMRAVALLVSRLKTCCVRMFGEIYLSKVSSVIDSPFVVADSMPGGGGARGLRGRRGEQRF